MRGTPASVKIFKYSTGYKASTSPPLEHGGHGISTQKKKIGSPGQGLIIRSLMS